MKRNDGLLDGVEDDRACPVAFLALLLIEAAALLFYVVALAR